MDKETFCKALVDAGFNCEFKNGIPTVHADNKKAIAGVRKLKKELGYDQSFGIIFDGARSPEVLDKSSEDSVENTNPDVEAEENISIESESVAVAELESVNSFDLFDEFSA